MGTKKQVSRIAEAVAEILDRKVEPKKLTKERALKRFLKRMKARRAEILRELEQGGRRGSRERMLRQHLETLDKQIKKAGKILADL